MAIIKKHNIKDKKRRTCLYKHNFQPFQQYKQFKQFKQFKQLALKTLRQDQTQDYQQRIYTTTKLASSTTSMRSKLSKNVKVNRCVITGRSRGIYNYLKISRIMIKELASKGLLPGIKKATW